MHRNVANVGSTSETGQRAAEGALAWMTAVRQKPWAPGAATVSRLRPEFTNIKPEDFAQTGLWCNTGCPNGLST